MSEEKREVLEYLAKVEDELVRRRKLVAEKANEIVELEGRISAVATNRDLRGGNITKAVAGETYKKSLRIELENRRQEKILLEEDVNKAVVRKAVAEEELAMLAKDE